MNIYKRLFGFLMTGVASFVFVGLCGGVVLATGDQSDNAVIRGGVFTTSQMRTVYSSDATVQQLFTRYGMTRDVMTSGHVSNGTVTKDGHVIVGGKTLATGARSVGRQNMPGSSVFKVNGTNFYERSTQTSFNAQALDAFVFVDAKGQFIAAVIKDCGNPVAATPKPPVVMTKQNYSCDRLTGTALNAARTKYTFTAQSTVSGGATLGGYIFDFGDGTRVNSTTPTQTYEYKTPGSYSARVYATIVANGASQSVTSNTCVTGVTVPTPPAPEQIRVCDLTTKTEVTIDKTVYEQNKSRYTTDFSQCKQPEYMEVCVLATKQWQRINKDDYRSNLHSTKREDCAEAPTPPTAPIMPETGPMELVSSMFGVGSLAGASYYYRTSRRDLLTSWLGR